MDKKTPISITTPFNTREAADYLGVRSGTLEAWRIRGGGPLFIKMGRSIRYRLEDLQRFIEENIKSSTSE
jgi:excisionase family DNA binding protein